MLRTFNLLLLLVTSLLFLVACNTETVVANDRSQAQAAELVTLLSNHGITASADQKRGSQGRYSVKVDSRYYNQAIAMVHGHGLAGDPEPTFSELLSSGSFLPSSRAVEKFKLDLALATLVEQSLKNVAGVSAAKVVVRQNFNEADSKSSAAVVVLVNPQVEVAEGTIRTIVQAAIPEIPQENIIVQISQVLNSLNRLTVQGADNQGETVVTVPLRDFVYWKVPAGEFNDLAVFFIAIIGLAALVFGFLGFLVAYLKYNRAVVDPPVDNTGLLGIGSNDKALMKKLSEQ